ncbi:MAG: hypothetical protein OER77_15340, partial [Myxococcales bacterium]|nr:hypothetical protein [Myxococcales bacterium]
DGTQVIPESWISECLDQRRGTAFYMGDGSRYHNQMVNNGEARSHVGIAGQLMYANPTTKVVVVQFSTTTMPSQGDMDFGNAIYNIGNAINDHLRS